MALRLALPHIEIYFDGSTDGPNTGKGGAAAVIYAQFRDNIRRLDQQLVASVSNTMGTVGNNCAEYYGLLLGLREMLHGLALDLHILGNSEHVIK